MVAKSRQKSQQVGTYHNDTEGRLHQQSKRLGCPVSNVFYGGDLTLELGLAECFKTLRENQISEAAKGVDYLDALWEGYDDGR